MAQQQFRSVTYLRNEMITMRTDH